MRLRVLYKPKVALLDLLFPFLFFPFVLRWGYFFTHFYSKDMTKND